MRLSWNEIRARAAEFARNWADASCEKGEAQSFYNDFFEVFGVKRRSVARYEEHVAKLDNRSGHIDLFWPGQLLVEQKSARPCPPDECSFVFGNPPFLGAKYQTDEQRGQVRRIADLSKSGGTLDYVAAWFVKAGGYVRGGNARIGFVATNSITQGEQVAQPGPILFERCELEIAFAHRTFAWGSDACGKAHVHVVIL